MKIFIHGRDNRNWSIDNDRKHLETALSSLGYTTTNWPISGQIFYNVWWNLIDQSLVRMFLKIRKPFCVLATVTNDLEFQDQTFLKVSRYVDYWIYANSSQKSDLVKYGVAENRLLYCPFYVDTDVFKNLGQNRRQLAEDFAVPYTQLEQKTIIGSFQRDSLGNNLKQPKWQKNPDLLLDICSKLDSNRYLLLLAGPRRHYIVSQCKLRQIPFYYLGDDSVHSTNQDDLSINFQPLDNINKLYNLIDICLVTSKSEGGPKAVLESALAGTPVLSTPVGMATDILSPESLCENTDDFISKIQKISSDNTFAGELSEKNYQRVSKINNFESYTDRISKIMKTTEKGWRQKSG